MTTTLDDCSLVSLPRIADSRGALSFVEGGRHVPFAVARLFYMYDFAPGTRRGGHAHKECHQFLIAQEGRFEITLDDGTARRVVVLDRPDQGLHIPPGIWVTLVTSSERAVITALASAPYVEADYLRDYAQFTDWKSRGRPSVRLIDGAVLVRPYRLEDAAAFAQSARGSAAEVGQWLPWCSPGYDETKAAAYIRLVNQPTGQPAEFSFGVFTSDAEERHLGGVSLNRIEWADGCANLGYWMATRAAGRGYGTVAARLMCRHGFETLGLHRIQIQVEVGNEGSRRVAEKLGSRLEGTLRGKIRRGEGWSDALLFGLQASEFTAGRGGGGPCAV